MTFESLATRLTISHEDMWRSMRLLQDRVYGAVESDSLADDCLDILVELLGADRGLILRKRLDGTSQVINARGQQKALSAGEREELSRTIVAQCLASRDCVVWDPLSAANASASAAHLGIVAALAAPLFAPRSRSSPRGVLYVDFRDPRKFVEGHHVEFFAAAATLFGAVFDEDERRQTLREHLQEAQAHCTEARPADSLGDLLTFPSMQAVHREIESALASSSPVLIVGESGTGKTRLAQAIAEASGLRPIVRSVLGSSDDLNTITSELFGHERGAYSGASAKRAGLVHYANGGVLLLDEILNLPPHAQQLLLDFTQFGLYRPLGYEGAEPKRAKVRIIASTNGDLVAAIRERRFREDLYYRLAAVTLSLPPLRSRREDIPVLAESTLRRVDRTRAWALSVPLRKLLLSPALEWAGNIRQLEHAIERARERAVARDPEANLLMPEHFEARDLGSPMPPPGEPAGHAEPLSSVWQRLQGERGAIDEREQDVIRQALSKTGGVVAHAARELGIARTTLASRLESLGTGGIPRRPRSEQSDDKSTP